MRAMKLTDAAIPPTTRKRKNWTDNLLRTGAPVETRPASAFAPRAPAGSSEVIGNGSREYRPRQFAPGLHAFADRAILRVVVRGVGHVQPCDRSFHRRQLRGEAGRANRLREIVAVAVRRQYPIGP